MWFISPRDSEGKGRTMRRLSLFLLTAGAIALGGASLVQSGESAATGPGLLPDMQTVVPRHLQITKENGREILRFANGIANTGAGTWALRPEPPVADATTTTTAMQELRDKNVLYKCGEQPKQVTECYNVVSERPAGTFEFHPQHNHWHIGDVALFEVRKGSPTGPIVGGNSVKTTFCLIDWYKLEGNSPTSERIFWECQTSFQGISPGWVDQYHHSLPGMSVDLTGVPNGNNYFLVSTANYARSFVESNYTNNTAWVRFTLSGAGQNRAIEVTANSPCATPGLCGVHAPNR
jgi:Lysyl oxidase